MAEPFWTQDDIDTLKAAIREGVLTVRYSAGGGGPERMKTYQSLDAMRSLLVEMRIEVNGVSTYRLGTVRKGLGA